MDTGGITDTACRADLEVVLRVRTMLKRLIIRSLPAVTTLSTAGAQHHARFALVRSCHGAGLSGVPVCVRVRRFVLVLVRAAACASWLVILHRAARHWICLQTVTSSKRVLHATACRSPAFEPALSWRSEGRLLGSREERERVSGQACCIIPVSLYQLIINILSYYHHTSYKYIPLFALGTYDI